MTQSDGSTREWIEKVMSLKSDDYGHDCQALMEAESQLLQEMGEKFLIFIDEYVAEKQARELAEAERDKLKEKVKFSNWLSKTKASMTGSASLPDDWAPPEEDRKKITAYERAGEHISSIDMRAIGDVMLENDSLKAEIKELENHIVKMECEFIDSGFERRSLEEEVACLRSVLSEWDEDKSCYLQWGRANQLADGRKVLKGE